MQPGTETFTMNMGKIVPVRIIRETEPPGPVSSLGAEYLVRYTGTDKVCLDWGQNWYLNPGSTFRTRQVNIDRAAELRKSGY